MKKSYSYYVFDVSELRELLDPEECDRLEKLLRRWTAALRTRRYNIGKFQREPLVVPAEFKEYDAVFNRWKCRINHGVDREETSVSTLSQQPDLFSNTCNTPVNCAEKRAEALSHLNALHNLLKT